ncbi:MAG: hypothetical protein IT303_13110 [Dehalococcoidia bacterium]|nr:hypothetical protein [Dehalococcoidia bacterium]
MRFWQFCVRYPAWLLAAASVALGVSGAVDASAGYTGGFFLGFVGYSAGFLARRAERRAAVKAALAVRPQLSMIPGMKGQRESTQRRAA